MASNGLKWPHWPPMTSVTLNDLKWPKWPQFPWMAKMAINIINGLKWPQMASTDLSNLKLCRWPKMASNSLKWPYKSQITSVPSNSLRNLKILSGLKWPLRPIWIVVKSQKMKLTIKWDIFINFSTLCCLCLYHKYNLVKYAGDWLGRSLVFFVFRELKNKMYSNTFLVFFRLFNAEVLGF